MYTLKKGCIFVIENNNILVNSLHVLLLFLSLSISACHHSLPFTAHTEIFHTKKKKMTALATLWKHSSVETHKLSCFVLNVAISLVWLNANWQLPLHLSKQNTCATSLFLSTYVLMLTLICVICWLYLALHWQFLGFPRCPWTCYWFYNPCRSTKKLLFKIK